MEMQETIPALYCIHKQFLILVVITILRTHYKFMWGLLWETVVCHYTNNTVSKNPFDLISSALPVYEPNDAGFQRTT